MCVSKRNYVNQLCLDNLESVKWYRTFRVPTDVRNHHRAPETNLLVGAKAIAAYVFGNEDEYKRVYYLADKHCLPAFRLGYGKRAQLHAYIADIENWIDTRRRATLSGRRKITNDPDVDGQAIAEGANQQTHSSVYDTRSRAFSARRSRRGE